MRMIFGSEDENGFQVASEALVERFQQWLIDERHLPAGDATRVAGEASLALDWKWAYDDGDLGRWHTRDIAEFLLEWCPRKLSVSQADCVTIPGALAAFLAFLDASGLLAPTSLSADALAEAARLLTDEFVAEMGDESNFGMAKSLFGAASAEGVDLSDADQLQEWIEAFNARPEDDRRRIIPGPGPTSPTRPSLPSVALPEDAEVSASKGAAPIVAMFASFAAYVGTGRKLTQTGNLTMADARALVDLLGTDDMVDPKIGTRTFRTTSSAELGQLRQVFAWARKAGVLRVAHGRVVATKRGLALAKDPAACFDRAIDAILAIGPLASQRSPDRWGAWPEINALLDRLVVHLLTAPYVLQRPLPIDDLVEAAAEAVLEAFEFRSLGDDDVTRRIGYDVVDIVDTLALAGILRRDGVTGEPDPGISMRRTGGTVELTAAGVVTVRRLLEAAGYDAPTAGRFAEGTATELLQGIDPDDIPAGWGEINAWRRRRSPAQAASELAIAIRELDDPVLADLALTLMGDMDPDVAGPEVRKLTVEPATRGFALCWLVDHGLADPGALFDPEDVSWFVEVLVHRAAKGGPDGLRDTLALAGDHEEQVRVIGKLWRSPSVLTESVLVAIAEAHPVKSVAKAARKASFQRRSWLGA